LLPGYLSLIIILLVAATTESLTP